MTRGAAGTHAIDGFVVVLHHVRNVYPVEKAAVGWQWGFKFADGFFETFSCGTRRKAAEQRRKFVAALSAYWRRTSP